MRVVHPQPPSAGGTHDGLGWAAFAAAGSPLGGVLVLHGADSSAESHFGFCRAAAAGGLTALAFDARGHGAGDDRLGAGAIDDVVALAGVLRDQLAPGTPIGLRGSSMGGYLALVAARAADAAAVVAICPASAEGMRRGLAAGRFGFRADAPALDALLAAHDEHAAVAALAGPLLLLHAEGDEQVPVQRSRELAAAAPRCRYVELPGGHHRSIQHDAELQGESVRWLGRALQGRDPPG